MDNETISEPFVRIVGDGCDVMIHVSDLDDIEIAHKAIDLAFSRFKRQQRSKTAIPTVNRED